jgi:branched-subunit amino acid transport protein
MNAVVALVVAGVVAFATRSSFAFVVRARRGRPMPGWLDRSLTAAMPAGLAATVVVAVLERGGGAPGGVAAAVAALIVAAVVAWRTDSMLGVVGAGLVAHWLVLTVLAS